MWVEIEETTENLNRLIHMKKAKIKQNICKSSLTRDLDTKNSQTLNKEK